MEYFGLSKRQAAILDFIKKEVQRNGYPPSVREIGGALGLSSTSTVHSHLSALEKKGYLRRNQSKSRALEVCDSASPTPPYSNVPESTHEMVNVPIIGKIAAGAPVLALEDYEDVFPLPLQYLRSNKELFMLTVSGESMVEAGIFDGDLIIVEKNPSARNGQIVVAMIDDEATVKTFYKEQGQIRLQPENSAMPPIIVPDAVILGVVIGLFRRFW
ncbi:MAG: transcriptional repressor LexA [Clostridiales bacterium]|nr:transcriptional repressor LexA [Clostridiales bacterium]